MQKLWIERKLGRFKGQKEWQKKCLAQMVRGVRNKVWESIVFEGKVFVFYSKWTGESLEGFKYVLFIYVFIYLFLAVLGICQCTNFSSCGEQGLLSSCGPWAFHCSGFSCCGAWGPETGSAVVTQGLSCLSACGIFLDQGLNPCPLHWQVDSQPLDHKGLPICLLFVLLRLFPDTCWLKFFLPLLYFTLHKWS